MYFRPPRQGAGLILHLSQANARSEYRKILGRFCAQTMKNVLIQPQNSKLCVECVHVYKYAQTEMSDALEEAVREVIHKKKNESMYFV